MSSPVTSASVSLTARCSGCDARRYPSVGQLLAICLGFYALIYFQPFLVFIAIFVFFGAGQEANMYRGRALVEGVPAQMATITDANIQAMTFGQRV